MISAVSNSLLFLSAVSIGVLVLAIDVLIQFLKDYP